MSDLWNDDLLDVLSTIGDPRYDARAFSNVTREAVHRLPIADGGPGPSGLEREHVALAQNLFVQYGQEIGAILLLASLPQAYAAESGARVLAMTESLRNRGELSRRISRTAQFLLDVMLTSDDQGRGVPGAGGVGASASYPTDPRASLLAGGRGFQSALRTRAIHSHIRGRIKAIEDGKPGHWNPEEVVGGRKLGEPLNQEHLLGTYLSFCVTVWECLERLGIRWSPVEREAYFHVWDWVAELMGIGDSAVLEEARRRVPTGKPRLQSQLDRLAGESRPLRPRSVAEAQYLLTLVRDRNWPTIQERNAFQNAAGKRLLRALLDDVEDAMPGGMQGLPIEVMRYLVDRRVSVALGLGGGGLPSVVQDWVQGQARGWNTSRANPLVAPGMRWAANQVSLHSFVAFMDRESEPLDFGGISAAPTGLRRRSRLQAKRDTRRDRPNGKPRRAESA